MEVADLLVINKADGNNEHTATAARNNYTHALNLLTPDTAEWQPQVLTCSAMLNRGLDQVWEQIQKHQELQTGNGSFHNKRQTQLQNWVKSTVEQQLMSNFYNDPAILESYDSVNADVADGSITPVNAAQKLLQIHKNHQ